MTRRKADRVANPIDKHMPSDEMDAKYPCIRGLWVAALCAAFSDPNMMRHFRDDTGCQWTPATSPIGQMIDKATGVEADVVDKFCAWFNENVWGDFDDTEAPNG